MWLPTTEESTFKGQSNKHYSRSPSITHQLLSVLTMFSTSSEDRYSGLNLAGAYSLENLTASFYPNRKKTVMGLEDVCFVLWRSRASPKLRQDFRPNSNFLFTIVMALHFSKFLSLFPILSCLPLLEEGTTAGYPSLHSSHVHPCYLRISLEKWHCRWSSEGRCWVPMVM